MSGAPILIIGAGQAAQQAVASLRMAGYDRDIVLFGDEPHLPYQRPPLSKAFLSGEATAERLELRPASFYEDNGVDLRLGQRVDQIDVAAGAVVTAQEQRQGFSSLLIATGTRPRPLPLPGDGAEGVHHIRAIRDAERFRQEFRPGARLVILGGGYIGLEVAAKARSLGLDVCVIEGQSRILARVACAQTAAKLQSLHEARGVAILTDSRVESIETRQHDTGAKVVGVRMGTGAIIPADIVLIAVGAVPNSELADRSGIAVDNGILVDASTCTSAPKIFAAGDVACFPSRLFGRRLRLESVPNAVDQAKAAALAMLGSPTCYDPVPWFWSDQYDHKLQIAGLSQGHTRVEVCDSTADSRFSARYYDGSRLIAVDTLDDARSHMVARRDIVMQPPREVSA